MKESEVSKNEQIDRLTLHASDEGRSIYEKLGFVASNEMHFVADWSRSGQASPISSLDDRS
jgi:hypothetical protein